MCPEDQVNPHKRALDPGKVKSLKVVKLDADLLGNWGVASASAPHIHSPQYQALRDRTLGCRDLP
jgi:hypothetical protein